MKEWKRWRARERKKQWKRESQQEKGKESEGDRARFRTRETLSQRGSRRHGCEILLLFAFVCILFFYLTRTSCIPLGSTQHPSGHTLLSQGCSLTGHTQTHTHMQTHTHLRPCWVLLATIEGECRQRGYGNCCTDVSLSLSLSVSVVHNYSHTHTDTDRKIEAIRLVVSNSLRSIFHTSYMVWCMAPGRVRQVGWVISFGATGCPVWVKKLSHIKSPPPQPDQVVNGVHSPPGWWSHRWPKLLSCSFLYVWIG